MVNGVGTPTAAHTIASTPTSSTRADSKGGGKRARDDDIHAPMPGVSSAGETQIGKDHQIKKLESVTGKLKISRLTKQAIALFQLIMTFIDEILEPVQVVLTRADTGELDGQCQAGGNQTT